MLYEKARSHWVEGKSKGTVEDMVRESSHSQTPTERAESPATQSGGLPQILSGMQRGRNLNSNQFPVDEDVRELLRATLRGIRDGDRAAWEFSDGVDSDKFRMAVNLCFLHSVADYS
jgi:hypothetical protein